MLYQKTNNKKFSIFILANIILALIFLFSPAENGILSVSANDDEDRKKLALPLQRVLDGQITQATSWYEPTGTKPFVQVLVQTYSSDTSSIRSRITSKGGTVWTRYYSINGVDAWIPVSELLDIAGRSEVERITPNYLTEKTRSDLEDVTGLISSVRTVDSTGAYQGLDGSGVGIAILDSGVMSGNKGFDDANGNSRVKAQADIVQLNSALQTYKNSRVQEWGLHVGKDYSSTYYSALSRAGVSLLFKSILQNPDQYGHGTFVAGIAAGRDKNLSDNSDFTGIAPNANIVSVKVLDKDGIGQLSDVLRGIDWAILHKDEYNIRVINMSLGGSSTESYLNDPLCRAVRKATSEGIVVVVSAGNYGKDSFGNEMYGTISSPANDPTVITVGSANTFQTDGRSDDRVNTFSSRGPTRSYYLNNSGRK
ncbi:MAG: S8 family serine peptidase, partial [Pyrinomonadaceae bacterium]|nr:S8 family serine peptidase [Pyrinomonadaceae bacterium]